MRKFLCALSLVCASYASFAQSTFLNRHADSYYLLDYYDALQGRNSDTLHTAMHPVSQLDAIRFLAHYETKNGSHLSAIDAWDIRHIISKNGEWANDGDGAIDSKRPILKTIYAKQSDFFHQYKNDYSIVFNPIIYYQQSMESNDTSRANVFLNSKGIEVRGTIGKRLSFYSTFTDNQERGPQSHRQYVASHQAVPGATYYKDFKIDKPGIAQDYLYAAGYFNASLLKEKVNVSFGSSRFQIGDGYRSLFLSDFGSNYLFLRLNTRLGKFNYQNLFMELTPQYTRGADKLLPRKYAAIHHLSINLRPWLNVGLYESVVYGRNDFFDFQYLNPIIFYRSVEQTKGSPDNSMMGMNFKINTRFKTVLYGQVLLDEFNFSKIKDNNGWWGNKYGVQLGLKIAEPFGIKQLLIQPELNIIRPFTYSYKDSVAEFSHYNQSLAHPYGANLMELSLNIHYKASKKIALTLCSFYNKQGRDTASNVTFGGNIFSSYNNPHPEFGIQMFNGFSSEVIYTNLNASYEIKDNFFFDISAGYRSELASHPSNPTFKSTILSVGLRLNAVRRQYDY